MLEIHVREQKLSDGDAFFSEKPLILRHQTRLTDCRAHLLIRHERRTRLQSQRVHAGADRAGRDENDLIALMMQFGDLRNQSSQRRRIRLPGLLLDHAGANLHNNTPGLRQKLTIPIFDFHVLPCSFKRM